MKAIEKCKYGYILPDGTCKNGEHKPIIDKLFSDRIFVDPVLLDIYDRMVEEEGKEMANNDFPVLILGWIKVGSHMDEIDGLRKTRVVCPRINHDTKNQKTRLFILNAIKQMEYRGYDIKYLPYLADKYGYCEEVKDKNELEVDEPEI